MYILLLLINLFIIHLIKRVQNYLIYLFHKLQKILTKELCKQFFLINRYTFNSQKLVFRSIHYYERS